MSFDMKVDNQIPKVMQEMTSRMRTDLAVQIQRQNLFFIGSIQRQQMTGRRGGIYLNVQTGKLRRDWFSSVGVVNGELVSRIWSTTKYVAIHQHGGVIRPRSARWLRFKTKDGRFVTTKQVVIPKRLFIVEAYAKEWPERQKKAFKLAMKMGA